MDFQIPVAPGAPVDAAFENSLEALESRLRTLKVHGGLPLPPLARHTWLLWVSCQSDVLGTIRGHFDQFSKSFQCVNHLQSKVVSVSDHLKELAAGVGDAQLSVGPFEAAALESTIRQRLNAHEAMLNSLKVLAEVRFALPWPL